MAERFDVTVVGAGPAGIAAAVTAAEAGAKVALIDESERSGGQIWREDRGEIPVRARPWFTRLNKSSVTWLDSTSILDAHAPGFLETTRGPVESDRLVLATGARELFLPFPGWTLPGVTGAGGLQALVHEGLDVAGEKIVLAGTGPLLLQVASHLNHRGAKVIRVAEQAPLLRLLSFGLALEGPKRKQAFDLRNFRLRTSTWPSAALGKDRLEAVVLRAPYGEQTLACDRLGVGFSLVPNLELARRLGCACDEQGVTVGLDQATSVEGVFAAGEVCGVKGVAGALHDGICAGTAAAGQEVSTRMQYLRDIERSFGR